MAGTHPPKAQSRVAGRPHPSLPRLRGRVREGAGDRTGPAMSVAMPDCRANNAGGADSETGTKTDSETDLATDPPAALPRVRVMLPLPLPEPLDYLVPDGTAFPQPGNFVRVTLGPR